MSARAPYSTKQLRPLHQELEKARVCAEAVLGVSRQMDHEADYRVRLLITAAEELTEHLNLATDQALPEYR